MTLIACFHPRQCRTLLADVLISSEAANADEIELPTRPYIAPERLQSIRFKPVAIRRKVIEITPELVILWAGDYNVACALATRAKDWFTASNITDEDTHQFLDTFYREPIQNFYGIVAPASDNFFYIMGNVQKGESPSYGQYAVAGSGVEVFRAFANEARRLEGDDLPHLTAIRLANELLTREIATGETILSGFGAGYEILYRADGGFARAHDAMHVFTQVKEGNEGTLQVSHYPHCTRQWYEEDRLYIASLSSPDAAQEGLGSKTYVVPGVLGSKLQPRRPAEDLATRPKYMCIHQQFHFRGSIISSTLTLWGDEIDKYFKIVNDGDNVVWWFTSVYAEKLHEAWGKIVEHFQPPSAR